MTREEAIETLKANYPDACYEQLRESVDTAIEALKAQDTAGDTIYRQAAIDAVEKESRVDGAYGYMDTKSIVDLLNDLPSAQPEEAIPAAWLEEQAKWFESMDNAFAKIEANNIRVMIKKWRSEKDERSD